MTDSPDPFGAGEMPGPTPSQEGDGEFRCPECRLRCTKGPSGTEYGHKRHPRCSRRPDSVGPENPRGREGGDDG